jgi:hypothetical protein
MLFSVQKNLRLRAGLLAESVLDSDVGAKFD